MKRGVKLLLDILMGSVIPILALQHLSARLGTEVAYVVAALVPVVWVFIDLLFLTRRFNVITSYVGASAIVSGFLAFWFVDGVQFALKDTIGLLVTTVVFGGSLILGKPIVRFFFVQGMQPGSSEQERQLDALFEEPRVSRALLGGTMLLLAINIVSGVANFVLNLNIVIADFGTLLFNQQVARVNAITRVALSVPGIAGLTFAMAFARRAMYRALPDDDGGEIDFWDLLRQREAERSGDSQDTDPIDHKSSLRSQFHGSVLIVGAGAAGLTAGHLLRQQNVPFQILEASSHYGGRMKKIDTFTDFPLSVGAEWVTAGAGIFGKIVNDRSIAVDVETIGYKADEPIGVWKNGILTVSELGAFEDRKFVRGTWFDFFEKYIVPSVSSQILYESAVRAIDFGGDTVVVTTGSAEYRAERVIVTVPLPMIQRDAIAFTPALPAPKARAIEKAVVWDGIKVVLEFSEQFYPAYVDVDIKPKRAGHVTYFDAAYGQKSEKNIVGMIAVGEPARSYLSLQEDELKNRVVGELDEMFAGKASSTYINHVVQEWSNEPYTRGAYLRDDEPWRRVRKLSESIGEKVYFAGDAYTSGEDWGAVHTAALSARRAVRSIVR